MYILNIYLIIFSNEYYNMILHVILLINYKTSYSNNKVPIPTTINIDNIVYHNNFNDFF
jgi:hypothetical protein